MKPRPLLQSMPADAPALEGVTRGVTALAARRARAQFPITAIREIKILKVLNHKNVVRLKEIVTSKGTRGRRARGAPVCVP